MNTYPIMLAGAELEARSSGALYWADEGLLCVSDLHLGKSGRTARRGGSLLPPYETEDTLLRLETEIEATGARHVLCLGDSFDDLDAARTLQDRELDWLARLMAGRQWSWVEGNHDPGPLALGGSHAATVHIGPLSFRHIAAPTAEAGEITGHYHPKATLHARGRSVTRPCFLFDQRRLILPAFGTYTGGLRAGNAAFKPLFPEGKIALLAGSPMVPLPL